MSMCRVISCVVGRGYLLWSVCSLGKTLLSFALIHFVLQGQICLLLQISLDFLPLHSQYPIMKRTSFFGISSRRSCRASQNHSVSVSLRLVVGAYLDYCGIEWFALATNKDHSVLFETAPKSCISDSFVDYEGYSISSKEFLPKCR